MTHATKSSPRQAALPTAVFAAALLLAGCSSGHVGESWQCPLPDGGTCDSVAAADPAVPRAGTGKAVIPDPLWRGQPEPARRTPLGAVGFCEAGCGAGLDPFAWLARLFGPGDDEDGKDRRAARGAMPATAAPASPGTPPPGNENRKAGAAGAPSAAAEEASPPSQPSPARPAEPAAGHDDAAGNDLRTGEVVARIWIAPFVDAYGVYREASHVRVVLEPAGWRLP